jgi:hypothetical protein
LHFAGHGEFNRQAREGQIILETDRGEAAYFGAADLALALDAASSLRLVFLNTCEGATEATDEFAGVASRLFQMGIPAVIGMQAPISDRAATLFAERVYTSLVDRRSIDAAVVAGRIALKFKHSQEWSTPVLYLRSSEGVLFDFKVKKAVDANRVSPPGVWRSGAVAMVFGVASSFVVAWMTRERETPPPSPSPSGSVRPDAAPSASAAPPLSASGAPSAAPTVSAAAGPSSQGLGPAPDGSSGMKSKRARTRSSAVPSEVGARFTPIREE